MRIIFGCLPTLLALCGCASHGVIENVVRTNSEPGTGYSLLANAKLSSSEEIKILLTFSGGGTRAAAMAYGVLKELRDTGVMIDGQPSRLLDQVTQVSSVSGGSFTAAYYGLHGENDAEIAMLASGLASYRDKDQRKYIHLVDGGITDNLGLRTLYDVLELSGRVDALLRASGQKAPRRVVLIAVNAATDPVLDRGGGISLASLSSSSSGVRCRTWQPVGQWLG